MTKAELQGVLDAVRSVFPRRMGEYAYDVYGLMDCVESAMECTLRDIEDYARVSEVVYEQRVNVAEVWDDERDGAWATLSSPYAKDEHTLCFEGRTVEQLKDLKGRTLSVRVVAECAADRGVLDEMLGGGKGWRTRGRCGCSTTW